MDVTFDLESSHWGSQVQRLNQRLGIEAKQGLTEQARLLLEQLVALTPPHNRAEGVARTRDDIRQVIQPFNVTAFRSPKLEEIVNQRDYRAFEAMMRHVDNPALKNATAGMFDPGMHARARDGRGRVNGRGRQFFVLGKSDVKKLKDYTKGKTSNVGLAKSGWLVALWAVGGSVAGWISNQLQRGQGRVENALDRAEDPFIVAINQTPWANNRDEGARIVRYAVRYRLKAMETFLKKALARAAADAGVKTDLAA